MNWFEEEMNCIKCGSPMRKCYKPNTFRYQGKFLEVNQQGAMVEAVPEFMCVSCKITIKQTGILC